MEMSKYGPAGWSFPITKAEMHNARAIFLRLIIVGIVIYTAYIIFW